MRNCATWLTEEGMRNDIEISWLHLFQVLMARNPRWSRKTPHITKMNRQRCPLPLGSLTRATRSLAKQGHVAIFQVDCPIHDPKVNWHQTHHFFSSKELSSGERKPWHVTNQHSTGSPPLVYLMTSPQPAIGPRAIPTISTCSSQYVD